MDERSEIREHRLCMNWDVLISEACSDTLVALKEEDEEYAAALRLHNETIEALWKLVDEAQLGEPFRTTLSEYLDTLLYGVGTQEYDACFIAGAGAGIRLAHRLGLLKL